MPDSIKGFAIALTLLALCGCAAPPARQMTPFVEADFAPWLGEGPATLRGQAFLKTVGGDVKTCAGEAVALLPANAYDREVVENIQSGRGVAPGVVQQTSGYVRITTCDAQGNFSFTDLPTRDWFVVTRVAWGVPTGSILVPMDTQGGDVVRFVSLRAGDNQVIIAQH